MRAILALCLSIMGCSSVTLDEREEDTSMPTKASDSYFNNIKGWSANGKLKTGDSLKSVQLEAKFEEAGSYTVQFAINPPLRSDGSQDPNLIVETNAEIVWKVAGNSLRRVVSVASGAELTAPCEAVSVRIFDVTKDRGQPLGTEYNVTVSVAPGTRFGAAAILRSNDEISAIPANSGANFAVPVDSGVVGVLVSVVGTSPLNVTVFETNGTFAVTFLSYDPATHTTYVPLVPGTSIVRIFNNDVANAIAASVIWQIDG